LWLDLQSPFRQGGASLQKRRDLMIALQRALEDYRTQQKRRKASVWIEAFCTGLITGMAVMSIIAYWIVK